MANTTTSQPQFTLPPGQIGASVSRIEIGTLQAIVGVAAIVLSIGVAWGTLRTLVKGVKNTLDKEITPDLKNVRERFSVVEDRVETLWKDKFAPAHSPRRLNERGTEVLNRSGIKQIIDSRKDVLLAEARTRGATNAYDAEAAVFAVVEELPRKHPELLDQLKAGAFQTGSSIDVVLLVGGLYLRDQIFSDLGFALEQIDQAATGHH